MRVTRLIENTWLASRSIVVWILFNGIVIYLSHKSRGVGFFVVLALIAYVIHFRRLSLIILCCATHEIVFLFNQLFGSYSPTCAILGFQKTSLSIFVTSRATYLGVKLSWISRIRARSVVCRPQGSTVMTTDYWLLRRLGPMLIESELCQVQISCSSLLSKLRPIVAISPRHNVIILLLKFHLLNSLPLNIFK